MATTAVGTSISIVTTQNVSTIKDITTTGLRITTSSVFATTALLPTQFHSVEPSAVPSTIPTQIPSQIETMSTTQQGLQVTNPWTSISLTLFNVSLDVTIDGSFNSSIDQHYIQVMCEKLDQCVLFLFEIEIIF